MGKCLVTKLNGAVNDSSLLRIGELVLELTANSANTEILQLSGAECEYSCEKAHILDTSRVEAHVRQSVKSWKPIKSVDAGTYRFHVFNKYGINGILSKADGEKCDGYTFLNSLTELYLRKVDDFDISALENKTTLKRLQISGNVSGDLACLKALTSLTSLSLSNNVYGDISALKNLTALTSLNLQGKNIYGDISALKNLTALTSLYLQGSLNMVLTSATMSEIPARSIFIGWQSMSGKNFGDLAVMHPNLCYIDCGSGVAYTWSSRPSSSKIIAIPSKATMGNIDKMLQDQAQCQVGFTSSDNTLYKTITVAGTRTSASDAAVAALQSKGYTVSITKA